MRVHCSLSIVYFLNFHDLKHEINEIKETNFPHQIGKGKKAAHGDYSFTGLWFLTLSFKSQKMGRAFQPWDPPAKATCKYR